MLEDGRLYTPDEVCANGWLGSDTTPEALRKAARSGAIEYTRFRNRIYFTRANVLANQGAGHEPAVADRRSTPSAGRRGRRTSVAAVPDLPAGATRLVAKVPKPDSARRRSRRAS